MIRKSQPALTTTAAIFLVVACLVVFSQTPAPRSPDELTTGDISGQVVNQSGQPLTGVTLFIRATNSAGPGRTTISDAEGNFRVRGLEPALYSIGANLAAYTMAPADPASPPPGLYRLGDTARLELIRGGAITGTVTNALGEPVIGVRVRAIRIRNTTGQGLTVSFTASQQTTDDRGIYRLYGLTPGTYLVSAGGGSLSTTFNPYENDIPTYAPSSTRGTASEVIVRSGEDSSADIRYRGEVGHTISGTVKVGAANGVSILLTAADRSWPDANTFQSPGTEGFAFHGLSDGDYDLMAQETVSEPNSFRPQLAVSEVKRVTVKGANVTGVELVTKPMASLNGRILLAPSKAAECEGKRSPLFAETLVRLQANEKDLEKDRALVLRNFSSSTSPDATGALVFRNLVPGRYQFEPRFYARYWYLQSITMSSKGAKPQKTDAAANWTVVKSGERLASLTITLAEGAASVRGRMKVADGAASPAGTSIYLLPAEPDKSEDVLRFFVTQVAADGTFALNNLPPGRYRVLTEAKPDAQIATLTKLRQPEAATARTKLRRTAETQKIELELKPCQNLVDYQLK
jgi:hypothetical protein